MKEGFAVYTVYLFKPGNTKLCVMFLCGGCLTWLFLEALDGQTWLQLQLPARKALSARHKLGTCECFITFHRSSQSSTGEVLSSWCPKKVLGSQDYMQKCFPGPHSPDAPFDIPMTLGRWNPCFTPSSQGRWWLTWPPRESRQRKTEKDSGRVWHEKLFLPRKIVLNIAVGGYGGAPCYWGEKTCASSCGGAVGSELILSDISVWQWTPMSSVSNSCILVSAQLHSSDLSGFIKHVECRFV